MPTGSEPHPFFPEHLPYGVSRYCWVCLKREQAPNHLLWEEIHPNEEIRALYDQTRAELLA